MKISKTMKNRFIEELKYVSDKMKQAKGLDEKLYYFSAVYGMAQRIFNFEFDPELIFIHQITQLAYNQIQQRFNIFKSGQQVAVGIPEQLYTVLQNLVEEMASRIEEDESTYPLLERMMTLSYATTGNGYYLLQKGELKL